MLSELKEVKHQEKKKKKWLSASQFKKFLRVSQQKKYRMLC